MKAENRMGQMKGWEGGGAVNDRMNRDVKMDEMDRSKKNMRGIHSRRMG